MKKKTALVVLPIAASLMLGTVFSNPALAVEKPVSSFSQTQQKLDGYYDEQITFNGDQQTVVLKDAKAEIIDGEVVILNAQGKLLETLPSQFTDAHGHLLQVVYDVSNPAAITFHFNTLMQSRFNWGKCLGGGAMGAIGLAGPGKNVGGMVGAISAASKFGRFLGPIGFIVGSAAGAVTGCLVSG